MHSLPQDQTISGTPSTATNELGQALTIDLPASQAVLSEPLAEASEPLVDGLEQQLAVSGLPGLESPPDRSRKWILIVAGTVPGDDLTAERDLLIAQVERAVLGLSTAGITLMGAAYRSDPAASLSESEATDTAPDAEDTPTPTGEGSTTPGEPSSDGDLDSSLGSSEESETSPNTSS